VSPVELRPEQSFASAAREVVGARSAEVFAHSSEKVLDPRRPEGVHKMRVATRRLRAALEVFEAAFPHKRFRKSLAEVKQLAGALGERRDRDVQIELLESLRKSAGRRERHTIDDLLNELRREQALANEQLLAALEHARESELGARLERLTE
jgi:CHAD domain-containing protein